MRKIVIITGALALAALAACGPNQTHAQSGQSPKAFDTTPVTFTPAPTPSPNGTFTGSCDYTLSSDIYGNDHLIGEIDLHNNGNIGTVVKVRITWPQEGYAPIEAKRTVKTKPGEHLAVRFHIAVPSTGNVITQLQSWQEQHNFKKGCTYKATITSTYGSPQS